MKQKVAFKISRHLWIVFILAVFISAMQFTPAALAEELIAPEGWLTVESAAVRSMAKMYEAEAALPAAYLDPVDVGRVRPTISEEEYAEAKAAAGEEEISVSSWTERGASTEPLAPPNLTGFWEGLTQAQSGNLRPPDTHGAVGRGYYLEIVNSRLAFYRSGDGAQIIPSVSLASFFNYFTTTIFDPRVVFDKIWKRWIVTAEAFEESNSIQYFFVALSFNENPTRGASKWYVYRLNVNPTSTNYFWDFPQVGHDQDSLIFTANIFAPSFVGASMFAVAKARMYNGLGWSVPWWHPAFGSGLDGTLAPPVVLDQNSKTFLLAAPPYVSPGGTAITKYTLTNSSRPDAIALSSSTINVSTAYYIPPDGRQLGTTATLDSLDCRFGNWSTQIGNSIWNTHSINFGGSPWAWAIWYEFDTVSNTQLNRGSMIGIGGYDDFMPPIAVNRFGDIFAVWTSSSPSVYARMTVSGKRASDVSNSLGPGTIAAQSTTFYDVSPAGGTERWGDYQCVDVDAGETWGNPDRGHAVGEYVTSNSSWRSRIAKLRFP